jgi:hypothetical protein
MGWLDTVLECMTCSTYLIRTHRAQERGCKQLGLFVLEADHEGVAIGTEVLFLWGHVDLESECKELACRFAVLKVVLSRLKLWKVRRFFQQVRSK